MEYLKNTTKKISWLLVINLAVSLVLAFLPQGLDSRLFDVVPAILVVYVMLPFVSGIILILVQSRNRSYEYLPGLLIGACLSNAIVVVIVSLGDSSGHTQLYQHFFDIYDFIRFYLPLVIISLVGGLIGLVIRGTSEQLKKYSNSKIIIASRKIFGSIFVGIGTLGGLISLVVFFVLFFNPSSSWLNIIMADFRLIEILGVVLYYLLLVSALSIILIPVTFLANWGLKLFLEKKFVNKKIALRLRIYFYISLVIFSLLSTYITSEFNVKTAEMKADIRESHIDIKDFKNIYISPYVEFDDVIIKQGDNFDITVKGSEYDRIGLNFTKTGDTLNIARSELETYFNTDTWTVENREILFRAGSKHLAIEITTPDVEKIENEGANVELENLEVDNLEIELTHRFNNIKGNVKVADTLKLEADGGIINLIGSAKNLVINSGDCWIEMDKLIAEEATINAVNTSRLNVYVTDNMKVQSGKNSGIVNYYDDILKSIPGDVSAKNYFDEDLKLSFTYPDNFYIETENLGLNFDIIVTPFAPGDPDRENPEGFIYTSLRMKKVSKGDEYNSLLDYFHEKAQDKELYPNYEERDIEINGNKIKLIKFTFGFSGGLDVNYLLDVGDYILHVSFYNDTLYAEEYGEITESIVIASSMSEELSSRLKVAISEVDISYPEESSLWWDDEDGYSIIVPGTESIEITQDNGSGSDNFAETSFARDVLDITDEVLTNRGFILNERNSSDDESDRQFYDYIRAYENDDELCVVRVNPDYGSFGCGDNMFMCNTIEITCGDDLVGSQTGRYPKSLTLFPCVPTIRIYEKIV